VLVELSDISCDIYFVITLYSKHPSEPDEVSQKPPASYGHGHSINRMFVLPWRIAFAALPAKIATLTDPTCLHVASY
jgi:hypothetical protein